jgi:hypothetical protein
MPYQSRSKRSIDLKKSNRYGGESSDDDAPLLLLRLPRELRQEKGNSTQLADPVQDAYFEVTSRQHKNDGVACKHREKIRKKMEPQDDNPDKTAKLREQQEREIDELPRDEYGNEICDSESDAEGGYVVEMCMEYNSKEASKQRRGELSEEQHHWAMEKQSKRQKKADALRTLLQEYSNQMEFK